MNIFSGKIHESEKDDATLTDKDVIQQAMRLISAGSDTMAVKLTNPVSPVLSQPHLHREIEELSSLSRLRRDCTGRVATAERCHGDMGTVWSQLRPLSLAGFPKADRQHLVISSHKTSQ
jgi:hypothetical protein